MYSVKTDAFAIHVDGLEKVEHLLQFSEPGSDVIGEWRVSKSDNITCPSSYLQLRNNRYAETETLIMKALEVPDEYDTSYICQLFEENRRVMVRAEYAGCGKTYACAYMSNLGYSVLIVCPTNRLCQNSKENSVTLNQFFSVGITENQDMSKFDDSSFKVIIFDEIYFCNIKMLARIKRYSESNPEK